MSEKRDVEARLDAVLADAHDALEESVESEEVVATPTLRAVASAASSLVEDADSESLLNAVDLGGEDGYDTIVAALSEGDEENVRELRQLLRLSKLADSWDDPEADDHRRELATLFGVGAATDEGDAEDGSPDAECDDADQSDGETADEDGLAEDIVDTVVERFIGEGDDSADAGDGSSEAETDADAGTGEGEQTASASLRSQVEGAVDRLRGQVGEDDADETDADETDAEDAEDDDAPDSSSGGESRGRLSTVPGHGRNPTRFSTMPEGGSSTRFSTMPKR